MEEEKGDRREERCQSENGYAIPPRSWMARMTGTVYHQGK